MGSDLDPIQRAADSARRATSRAYVLGHRQPDDHRRTGHYAAPLAAEEPQTCSAGARREGPSRDMDADISGGAVTSAPYGSRHPANPDRASGASGRRGSG